MGALSCVIARAGGGNGTNINWKQPTTGVNNTKMDDATLVVGCHEPLVLSVLRIYWPAAAKRKKANRGNYKVTAGKNYSTLHEWLIEPFRFRNAVCKRGPRAEVLCNILGPAKSHIYLPEAVLIIETAYYSLQLSGFKRKKCMVFYRYGEEWI
ncbi:uncharacterized protein LAJ45_04415 [Morchella importuna]|uniref:uncharacterized protein n=1 Tax=Morchella importuna TaxID=1174673 RepID=UPI001E8D9D71|nr:uncharacterized protein LAJ45_04415 [Morchella importuna]KAH8151793.1 hypothetical protein LAJ45_04415 [Morchella importuna]